MKTFKQFIKKDVIHYPDGVYISVKPTEETIKSIVEYQKKYLKGCDIADKNSLHCTLIYSKKPQVDNIESREYTAVGTFKEFNLFGPEENILVVEINSQDLARRNAELVEKYGFISDFDEYKSHISLSYNIKDIDINSLPPMKFDFTFINETVEPLNLNWVDEDKNNTITGKA